MYALYAYIHYIIMLLAYFIFGQWGDKISVHNNQRGKEFQYIITEEGKFQCIGFKGERQNFSA